MTSARPRRELGTSGLTLREWAGFIAMAIGLFMAVLDIQIVAGSLPQIQAGVSASADEITYVQTAYLVAEIVMIPFSGFLLRALSTRVVFCLSCGFFSLASLLCGLATSHEQLIFFRILQGFTGGALIPIGFSTTYAMFKPAWRGIALGFVAITANMADVFGPVLGGAVTEYMGWEWLFFINIIPGLLATTAVWFGLNIDKPDYSLFRGFDTAGLVLMSVFLGSLQFVIEDGPRQDWLDSNTVAIFAVVAAMSGALFLWRVLNYRKPIIYLDTLVDRNFLIGCLISAVVGFGMFGNVYLTPQYLSHIRGFNTLQIGQTMMYSGVGMIFAGPVVALLLNRVDKRLLIGIGLAMMAAGTWFNGGMTGDWGVQQLIILQLLRGGGLLFAMMPATDIALGTLPLEKVKNASGLFNLVRSLGAAMGLAAIATLLRDRFYLHHARLAEAVLPGDPKTQAALEDFAGRSANMLNGDPQAAGLKILDQLINQQALIMTYNDIFHLIGIIFFVVIFLLPLSRKPIHAVEPGIH